MLLYLLGASSHLHDREIFAVEVKTVDVNVVESTVWSGSLLVRVLDVNLYVQLE